MKLNQTDALALLDLLLERPPKTSRPGGFTVRLQRLRNLIAETGTAEPTLAAIAEHVFPGVSENSLRTTLLEFRKALAQATEAAGARFELIRPDARGADLSEIRCHFDGTPLPRQPEMRRMANNANPLGRAQEVSEEERGPLRDMAASASAVRPAVALVRPRIAAFKSSELERLAHVPLRADSDGRERLRFFVSYAHADTAQAERLLGPLVTDLGLSKKFAYDFWRDHLILPGEGWHAEIQDALRDCDFGLALVSRDFLASEFITKHELPVLVSGEKPLIPVALGLLDYDRQDLRGLEEKQIYRFQLRPNEFRCFAQCAGQVAERFVADLARAIEDRAEKAVKARKEALAMRALAEPEVLTRLAVDNPDFHRAIVEIQRSAEFRGEPPFAGDTNLDVEPRGGAPVSDPARVGASGVPGLETGAPVHNFEPAAETTPPPTAKSGRIALLREFSLRQLPPEKEATVQAAAAMLRLDAAERLLTGSGEDDPYAALERQRTDAVRYLSGWFRDAKQPPFAAVLGEIGSGKTTMLQMLSRALSKDAPHDAPAVFFVDLRDYIADANPTLEHLLADQLRRHDRSGKLTVRDLTDAVQTGGALIIFDGLDEKIIPLADGPRQRFIGELFRILPPDVMDRPASSGRGRVIISCRSHYFPSVLALASGFTDQQRAQLNPRDYTACFMLPWNEDQVADYLAQTLGEDHVEDALEIIGSVHNLTDLSRRPYLLSLIAQQIGDLERERAAGRPVNAASLYQTFVEKWLLRDDGKHQFTKEHKRLTMESLAADLWRDNAREWPWSRVAEWLDTFLYENPVIAARYSRDKIPADILNQDFRTATFFLRPDTSKDGFRFAHTSLLEFFLACRLLKCLTQTGAAAVWDLPMPSLETFDFAGQILETMSRADCERALAGLQALLENAASPDRARLAAFTFLVRAAKQGHPIPKNVAVQARDFDLTAWEIHGSEDRPLRLAGMDFSGATLIRASFRHVEMSDSRWHGADLRSAEFITCGLERANFSSSGDTPVVVNDASCTPTRLEGVRLRHCRIAGSRITGARLDGIRVESLTPAPIIERHWRDSLATYRSASAASGIWPAPLPTCSVAPLPPEPPLSELPSASWSLGHSNEVWSVAFSPEGTRLVSGSWDNSVRLWDVESGACLRVLMGHSNAVWSVVFSPDGTRLASGSWDNSVRLWDTESGACLRVLTGHSHGILSVAFSPDGSRLVSGAYDHSIRLWDAESGACLRVLTGHSDRISSVAFSPDGTRLVSGSWDNSVRIWDVVSGACLRVLTGHSNGVRSAAFSPDGTRLASGSEDNSVLIWDVESGACLRVLTGSSSAVRSVVFLPDGTRLASGSLDNSVRIWDVQTGVCLRVLTGHSNTVWSVAVSPDGTRLVSGSEDKSVRIWDAEIGACLRVLAGYSELFRSVAVSPDRTSLISASGDTSVRVWDAENGEELEVPMEAHRWLERGVRASGNLMISLLGTIRYTRSDGTELDIAALPDGGYAVLMRKPGETRWRLARAKGEYWRYVNGVTDTRPDGTPGRIIWPAVLEP
ncbi:MAG: TIR domain-containing protein [Verrucomicrobia bacterium]|nr:TIR domain-containing protein [Verrucomicrobiota bacterium]